LGATLANSGRTEEAINAYFNALEIKPSFVRARYNLGVGCMNMGCYKEAVEHYLSALKQHRDHPELKNVSNNLWETLRRALIMMERRDLADKAVLGVDLNIFRNEFDF
jgi:peroxin-5